MTKSQIMIGLLLIGGCASQSDLQEAKDNQLQLSTQLEHVRHDRDQLRAQQPGPGHRPHQQVPQRSGRGLTGHRLPGHHRDRHGQEDGQHQASTGESASWAGPVDHGRDDAFMGLLHLREHEAGIK